MSEVSQIEQDLKYVRQAVERSETVRHGYGAVYYVWAAYTLIGYVLIDFAPRVADWFFLIGWIPAAMISGFLHAQFVKRWGDFDAELRGRMGLHWGGGAILAIGAVIAMANLHIIPAGTPTGQLCVVLFGIIYFFAGVHFDRSFLVLGPMLVIGGLLVGFIPHYPWSILGALIATGLCVAGALNQRALSRSHALQA
jgi:hypothetical protein